MPTHLDILVHTYTLSSTWTQISVRINFLSVAILVAPLKWLFCTFNIFRLGSAIVVGTYTQLLHSVSNIHTPTGTLAYA